MREFINHLTERNYKNRTVGIIENGSWAPVAGKVIKKMLENSKDLTFADNVVTIRSAVNEQNVEQIKALASELLG
jgi:flavorubredoxin